MEESRTYLRPISCLVRRGGRKLERSPKETRMEVLSIWLALACLPNMEHGIFTNNETTGKGMGAICPFSNSISGTSVTMRNHLCHSSWHCLTVPNFSCIQEEHKESLNRRRECLVLCKHWNLLLIETLVLYFYEKKSPWKSNKHQFNSKPDQAPKWNLIYGKERKIPSFKQENNCKNEKLHCSEGNQFYKIQIQCTHSSGQDTAQVHSPKPVQQAPGDSTLELCTALLQAAPADPVPLSCPRSQEPRPAPHMARGTSPGRSQGLNSTCREETVLL